MSKEVEIENLRKEFFNEYEKTLGSRLKTVMLSVYKFQNDWSDFLGVNKSTISHWFNNRYIPSSEHVYQIREIVFNVGTSRNKKELSELFETKLIYITPRYSSFESDTLEEYASRYILKKIILNLNTFPETKNAEYYSQVSLMFNVFSTLNRKERLIFTGFFSELSKSMNFKKIILKGFSALFNNISDNFRPLKIENVEKDSFATSSRNKLILNDYVVSRELADSSI